MALAMDISSIDSCEPTPTHTVAHTASIIVARHIEAEERKEAEEALRESRAKLAREVEDMKLLQQISSLLIEEDRADLLYDQILDAAIRIMQADGGSMQMLDLEHGDLNLLSWRSLDPQSAAFWQKVSIASGSCCGAALKHGQRIIVPDVESADFQTDAETLRHFHLCGMAAVQSTPLKTRDGRVVGMISTHWRQRTSQANGNLAY